MPMDVPEQLPDPNQIKRRQPLPRSLPYHPPAASAPVAVRRELPPEPGASTAEVPLPTAEPAAPTTQATTSRAPSPDFTLSMLPREAGLCITTMQRMRYLFLDSERNALFKTFDSGVWQNPLSLVG